MAIPSNFFVPLFRCKDFSGDLSGYVVQLNSLICSLTSWLILLYCIAGNFQGRILLRMVGNEKFVEKIFVDC